MTPPPSPPPDLSQWQRLHPASAVVRAGPAAIAVILIIVFSGGHQDQTSDLIHIGVIVVVLLGGVVSWLVTRWRLVDGVLQIDTGLIRRFSYRFPLSQVQAIDIVRPGLARILGLAELRVRTASGSGSRGRLAYLTVGHAEILRAQLLALAHGLPAATPAPEETPLYMIEPGQLLGSLLISGPVIGLVLGIVGLVLLGHYVPGAAGATYGGSITSFLGVGGNIWRRFNGEYRMTVADAPDGLRVRAGLVETSAETIPRGRVQALRLVQPITWRPMGWWRVEVDVAGRAPSGRQNRSAQKAARALLPVGTMQQAGWVIDRVFPGARAPLAAPPRRARWKSPLRYRRLSAGVDPTYAIATSGRLRRVTDFVPLAKVQSIRWVQGPVQRRLELASVHLDTAGRSVFAVLRDRDHAEADAWIAWLPAACRAARARDPASLRRAARTP